MATPPTLVSDYEGAAWNTSTTPKTTGAFNGTLGDVLVAFVGDGNDDNSENYTFSSSPAETWAEGTETSGTINADVWIQAATAVLTADRTGMTVSAARTAGAAADYGLEVAHFTASAGVGASATKAGAGTDQPSLAITTLFDNSAIVYFIADWAAADGTTRTHRTVNGFTPTAGNGQELLYFRDPSIYTIYCAYIPDAGTAGSKTVGLTAPTGQDSLTVAVEVRGTTSGGGGPVAAPMFFRPTQSGQLWR